MNANVAQFPTRDNSPTASTEVPVYQPKGEMRVGDAESFDVDLANLKLTSACARNSQITGEIHSTEGYVVEGTLNGNIHATTIVVRPNGSINGNVTCNILIVQGSVGGGNINADKLMVTKTGKIDARDILYKDLLTYKGHVIEGNLRRKR